MIWGWDCIDSIDDSSSLFLESQASGAALVLAKLCSDSSKRRVGVPDGGDAIGLIVSATAPQLASAKRGSICMRL